MMNRIVLFFLLVVASALAICLALLGLETLRTNLLGWILLCLGTAYPAGILIDHHAHQERYHGTVGRGRSSAEERGDLSFWLILPGFLTAFFAPPLEWMNLAPMLPRTTAWQIVGVVLFLAGVALVVWARWSLRGSYTTHLAVQGGQPLVDGGPCRIVRHPGYSGLLLMALGMVIGYSSAIGMAAVPILLFPGLAYRIQVEERLLAAKFGEAYTAYARRTRRLIPGLW
ncbi:MAG: isoprenylcysteine carboxylmethyltransferase family protein [Chloroflexi bacterium]|nr:isoprenylcysteine carboxylmethyltransferase family protein [Chloroflexota bacterium]